MNIKHAIALSSLALVMGLPQSASAATFFQFNPNGTGAAGAGLFDLIDQAPGSALAVGGVNAIGAGAGSTFNLLYQANLAQVSDSSFATPSFSNGTGSKFFNFTMVMTETLQSVTGGGGLNTTANFKFTPSATDVFTMYVNNAPGNNLTGAGFGAGTAILTAHITSSVSSSYTTGGNISALDQSANGNQWGTTNTVEGSGATDLNLVVDSFNAGYFPDLNLTPNLNFTFLNTSQVTPFKQVDPSKNFVWAPGGAKASNLGGTNGLTGPDFIFQADANQSVTVGKTVPEPTMLFLLGIGLAGFSLARNRIAA